MLRAVGIEVIGRIRFSRAVRPDSDLDTATQVVRGFQARTKERRKSV